MAYRKTKQVREQLAGKADLHRRAPAGDRGGFHEAPVAAIAALAGVATDGLSLLPRRRSLRRVVDRTRSELDIIVSITSPAPAGPRLADAIRRRQPRAARPPLAYALVAEPVEPKIDACAWVSPRARRGVRAHHPPGHQSGVRAAGRRRHRRLPGRRLFRGGWSARCRPSGIGETERCALVEAIIGLYGPRARLTQEMNYGSFHPTHARGREPCSRSRTEARMSCSTSAAAEDVNPTRPTVRRAAVEREGGGWGGGANAFGAVAGSAAAQDPRAPLNTTPELKTHDRRGNRVDVVEYPRDYELMRIAYGAGATIPSRGRTLRQARMSRARHSAICGTKVKRHSLSDRLSYSAIPCSPRPRRSALPGCPRSTRGTTIRGRSRSRRRPAPPSA
jgi:hypothetical protein